MFVRNFGVIRELVEVLGVCVAAETSVFSTRDCQKPWVSDNIVNREDLSI